VAGTVSFANIAIQPLNQLFHYSFPKYRVIPGGTELAANLVHVFGRYGAGRDRAVLRILAQADERIPF
jgi:hypothetical protein